MTSTTESFRRYHFHVKNGKEGVSRGTLWCVLHLEYSYSSWTRHCRMKLALLLLALFNSPSCASLFWNWMESFCHFHFSHEELGCFTLFKLDRIQLSFSHVDIGTEGALQSAPVVSVRFRILGFKVDVTWYIVVGPPPP